MICYKSHTNRILTVYKNNASGPDFVHSGTRFSRLPPHRIRRPAHFMPQERQTATCGNPKQALFKW